MADLITVGQLVASYGDVDETTAAGLITDVSAQVVDYVNDSTTTDSWDSTSTPGAVQAIVKSIVYGVLKNPSGDTGQTLGDHTWNSNPRTRLGILLGREEKRAIRRAVGKSMVGDITQEGYLPVEPALVTDDLGL